MQKEKQRLRYSHICIPIYFAVKTIKCHALAVFFTYDFLVLLQNYTIITLKALTLLNMIYQNQNQN